MTSFASFPGTINVSTLTLNILHDSLFIITRLNFEDLLRSWKVINGTQTDSVSFYLFNLKYHFHGQSARTKRIVTQCTILEYYSLQDSHHCQYGGTYHYILFWVSTFSVSTPVGTIDFEQPWFKMILTISQIYN